MTKAERQEQLEGLLLGLLPVNGSTVANGQLLTLWTQAAADAGLKAGADDFANLREDLVARGLVVKGKGRGGSTARASAAAPGSEAFTLEGQAAAAAEDAAGNAPKAKAGGKPKLRAADAGEEAQVLSYRHADRRKNNPEVGLVNEATLFDGNDLVAAYAKNDHLGFQIYYLWGGSRKRFVPDFIVRLANGKSLVLEIKGEDSPMNSAKRDALALWVKAVNAKGGFGAWCWDVAFKPAEIHDILVRHGSAAPVIREPLVLSGGAE